MLLHSRGHRTEILSDLTFAALRERHRLGAEPVSFRNVETPQGRSAKNVFRFSSVKSFNLKSEQRI